MKMNPKVLEICVDSFESAENALAAGASRIELCAALSEGGLTPTVGFLKSIQGINSRKVPIFCMIRCRRGSDFIYSEHEMKIMVEDAKLLRENGADGFVFGALRENGDVDLKKCREIIKTCYPLPVTFHRAFDLCKNANTTLEALIDVGFKRVLTSGQKKSALDGAQLIKTLIEKASNRIIIIPGCGINEDNLVELLNITSASEVHASARSVKITENLSDKTELIPMGTAGDEAPLMITDVDKVKKLLDILNND